MVYREECKNSKWIGNWRAKNLCKKQLSINYQQPLERNSLNALQNRLYGLLRFAVLVRLCMRYLSDFIMLLAARLVCQGK